MNFFRTLLLFTCFTFILSCKQEGKNTIPADVLDKEKMAEVMTDLQMMESAMRLNYHHQGDSLKIAEDKLILSVFEKNNVTEKQFDTSFEYYSSHPGEMEVIYESVINQLSEREAELRRKGGYEKTGPKKHRNMQKEIREKLKQQQNEKKQE